MGAVQIWISDSKFTISYPQDYQLRWLVPHAKYLTPIFGNCRVQCICVLFAVLFVMMTMKKKFMLVWWQDFFCFVMMTGKSSFCCHDDRENRVQYSRGTRTCKCTHKKEHHHVDLSGQTLRYSEYNIFWFSLCLIFFGGPVTQIFNYSIPHIYYRGLSLLGDFAELHTRVFLQRLFIFTNIIFADASLMWKTVKDKNLATLQMMHEEMSLWKTMQFILNFWRSWIGELMNFNL